MDTSLSLSTRLQHEARTPLNAILGMVELLEATALDETQREYVAMLRRSTETLIGVVDGLPAADESGSGAQPPGLEGMRILLVDDAEDNRYLVIRYLRGSGALVDEACDGGEAVAQIRRAPYDVVLMDLEMPVMDGVEATRAIREWERTAGAPHTRIIALSAHDPARAHAISEAAGCDELITKPVRKSTLINALAAGKELDALKPAYLAKRRAEVPRLRALLSAGDYEGIRQSAHKLAGTGAGYGFPRLSELGQAMQRAARESDAVAVARCIDVLEREIPE